MKQLLTIAETANYVNLSVSKINRLESENRFVKRVAIGGNIRFRVKDLDEWIDLLQGGGLQESAKKPGRKRMAL